MENVSFEQLLKDATREPGRISKAYSLFHGYSLGNQLLALGQCYTRGIEPGPINTYKGWQAVKRQVRKGQRALTLCMPVTHKTKDVDQSGEEKESCFTRFIFRPNWFVLDQTDGEAYIFPPIPEFNLEAALAALNISRTEFDLMDGNVQGFARAQSIAVSPIAAMPWKTTFHEMAHVLLGHTADKGMADSESTPRSLCEVEAESVAMLCCASLGLPGVEFSRGYIQKWMDDSAIPEKSAQKIFKTANVILKAGQQQQGEQVAA